MELNKKIDESIRRKESSHISSGFKIKQEYENYMSNEAWDAFKKDMKVNYPKAYQQFKEGGGKEMEIRQGIYPPKMASFGSSSRMLFELMKDDQDFDFELQLPTTVGGMANLDGFKNKKDEYIFVEAKCREPYSSKNHIYPIAYESLYEFIHNDVSCGITCVMDDNKGKNNEMKVIFQYHNKVIKNFDMKQMISHLLGIATAFLNDKFSLKKIHFIYLLYQPENILDSNVNHKIQAIYQDICETCVQIDFKCLFECVLKFLQKEYQMGSEKDITAITNLFHFDLCDQNNFKYYI